MKAEAHIESDSRMRSGPFSEFDVLVVGAGISGLIAACRLAESSARVALVEARPRIGGRMHSIRVEGSDLPIELGAEFIHGRPPELLQLLAETGQRYFELDGESLRIHEGKLQDGDFGDAFSVLYQLPEEPDRSFASWLAEQSVPEAAARSATAFVEGFDAADATVIGTKSLVVQQRAEDAIDGDRAFRLEDGYSSLADSLKGRFLAAGGVLLLSTPIHTIRWKRGRIEAEAKTETSETLCLRAKQCVLTLPLGVLQSGNIHFDPVPARPIDAAFRLAMGSATRVTFVFAERFWADKYPELRFLFLENALPSVWWTPAPNTAATLTAWIGGPRTKSPAIAGHGLIDRGIVELAKAFSLPADSIRSQLRSWHTHDWQNDPFSRGAYSYVPAGALDALSILAEPVENTLFFAGEHTDTEGTWSTVHGALRSGLRAVRQILG